MEVWAVFCGSDVGDYDEEWLQGIYSSRDAAIETVNNHTEDIRHMLWELEHTSSEYMSWDKSMTTVTDLDKDIRYWARVSSVFEVSDKPGTIFM